MAHNLIQTAFIDYDYDDDTKLLTLELSVRHLANPRETVHVDLAWDAQQREWNRNWDDSGNRWISHWGWWSEEEREFILRSATSFADQVGPEGTVEA